jgi:hypothetical protein
MSTQWNDLFDREHEPSETQIQEYSVLHDVKNLIEIRTKKK